jgi:hypothetical protein
MTTLHGNPYEGPGAPESVRTLEAFLEAAFAPEEREQAMEDLDPIREYVEEALSKGANPEALRRTCASIIRASAVGPEDALAAGLWWQEHAPRQARTYLDAGEADG